MIELKLKFKIELVKITNDILPEDHAFSSGRRTIFKCKKLSVLVSTNSRNQKRFEKSFFITLYLT
jgi:hypothetical protein